MYVLYMNPVTANAENFLPVVICDCKETLEQLLVDEKLIVEMHVDGYLRTYRDGLLYNYNPPSLHGVNCFNVAEGIVGVMSFDDLVTNHKQQQQAWMDHFGQAAYL